MRSSSHRNAGRGRAAASWRWLLLIIAAGAVPLAAARDAPIGPVTRAAQPQPAHAHLRGKVVDAHGGGVRYARLKVTIGIGEARRSIDAVTDEAGRFDLTTTQGPQRLYAEAPGYASVSKLYVAPADDAELRLQPAGSVRGRTFDRATGKARASVRVYALSNDRMLPIEPATSGADGTFAIDGLPAGSYELVAETDHASGASSANLALSAGGRIDNLQIPLTPAAQVRVNVPIVGTGNMCREGSVHIEPAATGGELFPHRAAITRDGYAELAGVRAGAYRLHVRCFGHVYAAGPHEISVADSDLEVSVQVAQGLDLNARVVDVAGAPVPYAEATLTRLDDSRPAHHIVMPLRADAHGSITLRGALDPGHYTLESGTFMAADPVPVELSRTTPTRELTLQLKGSSYIDVEARDQRGQAVSGLQVMAFARGKRSFVALEQGAGRYRIGPLTPDHYRVSASNGSAVRASAVELSARETTLVRMDWQR